MRTISVVGHSDARITGPIRPEVVAVRYGIIKHDARDIAGQRIAPDTSHSPDLPIGTGQGNRIIVPPPWWRYFEKVLDQRNMKFAKSVGWMWINKPYNWSDGEPARADSINCGGNFFAYTDRTPTHLRQVTYSNQMDTNLLDPQIDNWMFDPALWFKGVAIDRDGRLYNIGGGDDYYLPNLRNGSVTGVCRWVPAEFAELFPELPIIITGVGTVVRYKLLGASVIGILQNGEEVWLRKATKPGELIQAHPEWQLQEYGVIPPKDWHIGTSVWGETLQP